MPLYNYVPPASYLNTKACTTSGNFIVGPNTYMVYVSGIGGGQTGAAATSGVAETGAHVIRRAYPVTPGQSIPYVIGAGGVGGTANAAGGDSSFGTLVIPGGGSATVGEGKEAKYVTGNGQGEAPVGLFGGYGKPGRCGASSPGNQGFILVEW